MKLIIHFMILSIFQVSILASNDMSSCLDFFIGDRLDQEKCFEQVQAIAELEYSRDNGNSTYLVKGASVVFKRDNKYHIIGGEATGLHHILDIDISVDGSRIAVLNQDSNNDVNVLIFPTHLSGNIKPYRTMNEPHIHIANHIAFSANGDSLFVVSPIEKKVFSYSMTTNSRHPDPKNHPVVLSSYSWSGAVDIVDIVVTDKSIALLDNQTKAIISIDLEVGESQVSAQNIFQLNLFEKDLFQISFSLIDNSFTITTSTKENYVFSF